MAEHLVYHLVEKLVLRRAACWVVKKAVNSVLTRVAHLALRKAEYLACPKVALWDVMTAENLVLKMAACSGTWMVEHLVCWKAVCLAELWVARTVALWEERKVGCWVYYLVENLALKMAGYLVLLKVDCSDKMKVVH